MLTDEASGVWTIDTPNLSMVVRQNDAEGVVLASLRTAEQEWVASAHPLFVMDGSPDPSITLRDATATAIAEGGLQVEGKLEPTGLTVIIDLIPYSDYSVVSATIRVRNDTDR